MLDDEGGSLGGHARCGGRGLYRPLASLHEIASAAAMAGAHESTCEPAGRRVIALQIGAGTSESARVRCSTVLTLRGCIFLHQRWFLFKLMAFGNDFRSEETNLMGMKQANTENTIDRPYNQKHLLLCLTVVGVWALNHLCPYF